MLDIIFITLFPLELKQFFEKGIIKRAVNSKKIQLNFINLRNFGIGNYKAVDDVPFGGKGGMLLRADVISDALNSIQGLDSYDIVYPCPKGSVFNQEKSRVFLSKGKIIFLIGYYEGVDDRIFDLFPIQKISIGDFVLNSGETASLAIAETIIRQYPGVLGNPECINNDSISCGVLEHPQYTQPQELQNFKVPDILRSGHHKKIVDWKRHQALKSTLYKRPDLLIKEELNTHDKAELTQFIREKYGEIDHE